MTNQSATYFSGTSVETNLNDPISVTATTRTLAITDAWSNQLCSNAATQTITVPQSGTVQFTVGATINFYQMGAGKVTFSAAGGVTIHSLAGNLSISGQYGKATLYLTSQDNWVLSGNLST